LLLLLLRDLTTRHEQHLSSRVHASRQLLLDWAGQPIRRHLLDPADRHVLFGTEGEL
jgi:hypothetical protein